MYAQALNAVLERLAATARDAGRPVPRLLAVSKTQPATAVAEMAAALRSAAAHELNVTGVAHASAFGENRSEEHTSELQSLMRISYAVFCLKKKKTNRAQRTDTDA